MINNIKGIEQLAQSRTIDLSEPIEQYLAVAAEMEQTNQSHYITRASFILQKVEGNLGKEIFEQYCEDWEVWKFPEQILTVEDF